MLTVVVVELNGSRCLCACECCKKKKKKRKSALRMQDDLLRLISSTYVAIGRSTEERQTGPLYFNAKGSKAFTYITHMDLNIVT